MSCSTTYEVTRPIVLFVEPVAARSEEVNLPRSTVGDEARRFVQDGMPGLVDIGSAFPRHLEAFPERIAVYLLTIKQRYPRASGEAARKMPRVRLVRIRHTQ